MTFRVKKVVWHFHLLNISAVRSPASGQLYYAQSCNELFAVNAF